MTPQEYCKKKTKSSNSNFLPAFLFLEKNKRNALIALYAFCREVDDVVDECEEFNIAKKKLNWWRNEINRLYKKKSQHPVTKALEPFIDEYQLNQEYFIEIIDGMEMDLTHNRYQSFKHLQLYCYRVASTVGILSAHIFGFKNHSSIKYAHNLGIALQLTNIIRDIGEDAKRNRIYIPQDELKKFNIKESDIFKSIRNKKIRSLVFFQSYRAKQYYQLAIKNLPLEDTRLQKPGLIMANIYYVLLNQIEKDRPENILNQKTSLSNYKKLQIALLSFFNHSWIK